MKIALAKPDLGELENNYVNDALSSGWISSTGIFIEKFEKSFANFVGTKFGVATNNGTTALHLALVAAGISSGDEVIVPTLTYVATANAVTYTGAKPIFVDSEKDSLNLDPQSVLQAITPRTKAIIAVHLYGIPAKIEILRTICDERNIILIEDCAEAHGATVSGKKVGSIGHISVFSFFGNKILTTGEGGIVLTDDPYILERLRLLRGQGMDPKIRYWFPVVGFNYRMTNIAAALGLAQVERVEELLSKRRYINNLYAEFFSNHICKFTVDNRADESSSVPWLRNIYFDSENIVKDVIQELSDLGIESRPVFVPMHQLPMYKCEQHFPNAERWSNKGISLPLHTALSKNDVSTICNALVKILENK